MRRILEISCWNRVWALPRPISPYVVTQWTHLETTFFVAVKADVSIVHPLAPSVPWNSIKTGSEAIAAMERVKHSKYDQSCLQNNIIFTPFAFSTFGQLDAESIFRCASAVLRRRVTNEDDMDSLLPFQLYLILNAKWRACYFKVACTTPTPRANSLTITVAGPYRPSRQ